MSDSTSSDVLKEFYSFFTEPLLVIFNEARSSKAVNDRLYCRFHVAEDSCSFIRIFKIVLLEPFYVVVEGEDLVLDRYFESEIPEISFESDFFISERFIEEILSFTSSFFRASLENSVLSRELIFNESTESIFSERDDIDSVELIRDVLRDVFEIDHCFVLC